MENTLLVGLSRQMVLQREMEVVANNIANIDTNGFKADFSLFEEYLATGARDNSFRAADSRVSFVRNRGTLIDLTQGSVQQTGSPLDVAINGDGFLVIQTPQGERWVAARAEDVGRDPLYRETFDVAVARALAPMPVLAELCLPLVRVGGRLLAQKTDKEDVAGARRAIEMLGGSLDDISPAPSAARSAGIVVVVGKIRPTPAVYPRRPGAAARKPL